MEEGESLSPPPKNVGLRISGYVDRLLFFLLTYSNRLNKFYVKIQYLPHKTQLHHGFRRCPAHKVGWLMLRSHLVELL